MIDSPESLAIAFIFGMAVGAAYMWALWAVVQRLASTRHPGRMLLGSAALRIGILLAAWYWIADGRWEGLIACLLGFLCARFAATRLAVGNRVKRPTTS